jgi:hypothetical protein
MAPRTTCRLRSAALLTTLLLAQPTSATVLTSNVEQKCVQKLAKVSTKVAHVAAKEIAGCRDSDIMGSAPGPCPNAGNLDKITRTGAKLVATAAANCHSVCTVSQGIECVADALCPPRAGGSVERCAASLSTAPFDIARIGFPGPYCESLLGAPIEEASDLGECAYSVTRSAVESLIDGIYGSITAESSISPAATVCLRAIGRSVQKLAITTAKTVGKCRAAIDKGRITADPKNCATVDPKAAAKITAAEQGVRDMVLSRCSEATLGELDICGLGVGGTATFAEAEACLIALAREVADNAEIPAARLFSPVSIVEAARPPKAVCGDNVVNQLPNPFLLIGEECDGSDDSACPGQCLPPGDVFECTCGDRPRLRSFSSEALTESDAGWTGVAYDQLTADRAGYVVDLSNCDCDAFTGADCTGNTVDAVCDVAGIQMPFCSWDTTHGIRCDTAGSPGAGKPWGDGKDEDDDCKVCDTYSLNAGAACVDSEDCQAQCYNSSGIAVGPCVDQRNCGLGEVCRGRCDDTQTCIITPHGGPVAASAAGAAVCNVQTFRTAVTGTRNLVTGENEEFYDEFSVTHLGERTSRPCPVCGGFCVGGRNDLEVCEGRCESSNDRCRFDEDCPGVGEKCSDESPDCPGGLCQLQLICGTDPGVNEAVAGAPCRIEYNSAYFGTPSSDCPPAVQRNIGGVDGFLVKHQPTGSELKMLPFTLPCSAPGFELFDCPCPDDGGEPTKPNACTPACDAAGPQFGVGCADGSSSGDGTRCASGVNAGRLCDENADCPGSSCSDNPKHCTGDPAFERFACTTNADCGLGACTDACPGGRCVPLCVPEVGDPEDGVCAAGPSIYTCESPSYQFKTCSKAAADSGCSATCNVSGTPCDSINDCPTGELCQGDCDRAQDCEAGADGTIGTIDDFVGAGPCVANPRGCNLDPIVVEGGDRLNGLGDNTHYYRTSIWCFNKTVNAAVNTASGFGGPGVTREHGTNVLNVGSIP